MPSRFAITATTLTAYLAVCAAPLTVALFAATDPGSDPTATCGLDGGPGGGTGTIQGTTFTGEQLDNARTIVDVAVRQRLPRRAAEIAVATAIVESRLRTLDHGDRDSLGVFQQRPSQGWGTPEQVLNPAYAAAEFYEHLTGIPGWESLPAGQAAQAVQRSAYPDRYAPQEPTAGRIVARFWRGPEHPVPPPSTTPTGAASPGAVGAGTGCPDQGKSTLDSTKIRLPRGFQLPTNHTRRAVVTYALAQVGKPYVWGAKGPDAFDCSGLTQAAWAHAGIGISSGTVNQVHDGTPVTSLSSALPGDLLFIPGSLGTAATPRHVGLYAGHGVVINAYDTSTGVITQPLRAWAADVVAIRRPTTTPRT